MGNNSKYTEINNYKLYVIYHEQTLQFYIGVSAAMDLTTVFSQHYSMQNNDTKELFKEYRETIYCPRIYVLQKVACTLAEAQTRKLAFIKHFIESGYTSLNSKNLIEQIENLEVFTKELYSEISEKNVEDYLSEKNIVLANYGRKRKEKSDDPYMEGKKQIKLVCTEEEYELIKQQAKRHNRSTSAYIREVALMGATIQNDFDAVREHTEELSHIKNYMNSIIKFYIANQIVTPADVVKMLELLHNISDKENALLEKINKKLGRLHSEIIKKLLAKSGSM